MSQNAIDIALILNQSLSKVKCSSEWTSNRDHLHGDGYVICPMFKTTYDIGGFKWHLFVLKNGKLCVKGCLYIDIGVQQSFDCTMRIC